MATPLMPKATAAWLVENTSLSFKQIADYTNLHEFDIQAVADGDLNTGVQGLDPVLSGQISREEIARCEADPTAKLQPLENNLPKPQARQKGPRYTPVSKRADKPDAIAWLIKHFSHLSDAQIGRLIGTTKNTISAIRTRSHWNMPNLRPRSPVELGFCSFQELQIEIDKSKPKETPEDENKTESISLENLANSFGMNVNE